MDGDSEESFRILEASRFWIHRVLEPIIVIIGVVGNFVTIIVLTRRKMRSTTNIYLTAMAVADLIHLLCILILSFKHYPHIKDRTYENEMYWRFYGIWHWINDAASGISLWLAVSFSIERYIRVCHALKSNFYCTERRAKNTITVVSLLCIMSTASTAFEYQFSVQDKCSIGQKVGEFAENSTSAVFSVSGEMQNCSNVSYDLISYRSPLTYKLNEEEYFDCNTNGTCIVKMKVIGADATALSKRKSYQYFLLFSSMMFHILPLVIIGVFNFILLKAVYKYANKRKLMTNSNESRKQTNENKTTIMLITIVVMVLICQTPSATILIYTFFCQLLSDKDLFKNKIVLVFTNVFNCLTAINGACNFILYTALSKNYRATFKTVFCDKGVVTTPQSVERQTLFSRCSSKVSNNLLSRSKSDKYKTPRNLETLSLTSIPRNNSLIPRALGKARSTDLVV